MIEFKGLVKKFGKVEVLNQLDLEIKEQGIFAILGPNGSGKTTLIKSLLGMVVPNKGLISINGKQVKNQFEYRNNINYLPQIANFPGNLSVRELIRMIKDIRRKPANDETLIDMFGLGPHLNKKLAHLSGGTKQKVNLVLTFMFDSDLVILDEPTSGLDPISVLRLKELIKEERAKGKTILITSHIISFVEEVSDTIVFILDGKIHFKGSIPELRDKTGEKNLEHAIANLLAS